MLCEIGNSFHIFFGISYYATCMRFGPTILIFDKVEPTTLEDVFVRLLIAYHKSDLPVFRFKRYNYSQTKLDDQMNTFA